MTRKIFFITIVFLALPCLAAAWPGKIVAVENADTFIVLKDGQSPVKVRLADVRPGDGVDPAKARMESSNIALMKDVEVRELNREGDLIVGSIAVNGKSLSQTLIAANVLQSTASHPAQPPSYIAERQPDSQQIQSKNPSEPHAGMTEDRIITELNPEHPKNVNTRARPVPEVNRQSAPRVRYVQVRQSQPLGLWPSRTVMVAAPVATNAPVESSAAYVQQSPSVAFQPAAAELSVETAEDSEKMKQAGDIAKEDYELAVKVQKKAKPYKKTGFFASQKSSETFVGLASGAQLTVRPKSKSPYEDWGTMDGLTVRHFFPSGFGIGGDITYISNKGLSGETDGNATTAESYDYKKKNFDTYSLTAALLYRFYTGTNFSSYVAGHAGYSLFSFPSTVFHLSDGAPSVGAGAGFFYKFDSGFTIGGDLRYLGHIGTKSDDPDGYLGTMFNIGYTFD